MVRLTYKLLLRELRIMGRPMIQILPKPCEGCGKMMERKNFNGRLEDATIFNKRRFCSLQCAGKIHKKEMPTKSAIGKMLISQRKTNCEICGTTETLGIHHKDSNRYNNDPANHMTLCTVCHTKWHWDHGKKMPHKDNYQQIGVNV